MLALAAGCRWVSVREKDLPEDEQIALVRTLLPMARRHGARLTLHGDPAVAKICGADGVHLSAGSDPARSALCWELGKLIGVSIHTMTEAEAIDPDAVDYALAGPAFETPSKPGYGPEIGRKGLGEIARVVARSGARHRRAQRGPRRGSHGSRSSRHRGHGRRHARADPGQEMRALLATCDWSSR